MIYIQSASYSDEYSGIYSRNGTDLGAPYLVGSIGDTMWLSLNIDIAWSTQNVPMIFSATYSNITRLDQGSFLTDGFQNGDLIEITNTSTNNGTYTISSVNGGIITINPTYSLNEAIDSSVNIWGITPIQAIDFYYNIIQNGATPNYTSLSDPTSTQKLSTSWNGATLSSPQDLQPTGSSRAWWEGLNTTLTQTNVGGFTQSFTILHNFQIKPWFLSSQITNFKNETPIKAFQNSSCYQHVYQINARYAPTNPNIGQQSNNTIPLANTGWYNEFLNGGCPNYVFNDINYTISGLTVSQLDYIQPTQVLVSIINTVGSFNNGDKINLQFSWLPNAPSSYQNSNCREQASNINQLLLTDSCMQIIGSASKNGDNYKTGFQVFENVGITHSGNTAYISFTMSLGSYVSQTLSENAPNNTNYLLSATPQEVSSTTLLTTNRNNIIIDVNKSTTNPDNDELLEYLDPLYFYRYPDVGVNPVTNISLYNGDYSYASMSFCVATASNMSSFNVDIIATNAVGNTVGQEFILESWKQNTLPFFDGISNQVNIAQLRNFNLPQGSIQNIRSLERSPQFDTATWSGYQMLYGFQADYRYYLVVNGVPQPFTNKNFSAWSNFDNQAGWSLSFKTTVSIIDPETGNTTQFIRYAPIQANDATDNPTMSISYQTFDINGNNLGGGISNSMQTEVLWSFLGTGSFASIPSGYDGYQAQLYFSYNDGTSNVFDLSDTNNNPIGNWIGSPIIDIVNENLIQVSGVLDLTGKNITNYRMYAKLGYLTQPSVVSPPIYLLEGGGPFTIWYLEDGTIQYLEN